MLPGTGLPEMNNRTQTPEYRAPPRTAPVSLATSRPLSLLLAALLLADLLRGAVIEHRPAAQKNVRLEGAQATRVDGVRRLVDDPDVTRAAGQPRQRLQPVDTAQGNWNLSHSPPQTSIPRGLERQAEEQDHRAERRRCASAAGVP